MPHCPRPTGAERQGGRTGHLKDHQNRWNYWAIENLLKSHFKNLFGLAVSEWLFK